MDQRIAKELLKARNAVKEKLKSLKSDTAQTQFELEKSYKPLTDPIQELLSNIKSDVKKEPEEELLPKASISSASSTPKKSFPVSINRYLPTNIPSFLQESLTYESKDDDEVDPSNSSSEIDREVERSRQYIQDFSAASYRDYLSDFHELPRTYIDDSVRDTENNFDHEYGVVHDLITDKIKIGDSELTIVGKDVKIKGITYPGTVGLYELLFKKLPRGYNDKDVDNYMDILKRLNAYHKNYKADEQIQGTRSPKYLTIIKPYLIKKGILKTYTSRTLFSKPPAPRTRAQTSRSRTGTGMILSHNPVDYVYYDDPNELVERLKLLVASQLAGHTGHTNEISSIVSELREAGIIQ